jgi:uncharacterized protein YbjQ (UPF0145 family)
MEEIILVVALVIIGLVVGRSVEAAHFRKLDAAERSLSGILLSDMKRLPANWRASDPVLVVGAVVIATDYFKVFAASVRSFFGGRVRSYELLAERARREAIVRMLQDARRAGANVVWCVRIETSTIQGNQPGKSSGVEVMAYGTAMKVWEK